MFRPNHRPNLKQLFILALAALAGQAALAAEIVLFDEPGFNGRQVRFMEDTRSTNSYGFNDRASSIEVRSGRWEVCMDDDYQGFCAILEPGRYRSLDGRMNRQISSLRPVGGGGYRGEQRGESRGGYAAGGEGGLIEFYVEPGFRGQSFRLERTTGKFYDRDMNDSAESVIVHAGSWVLCSDSEFRGTCRTFKPGRYAKLSDEMHRSISSARLDAERTERNGYGHGGRDRRDDRYDNDPPRGRAEVEMFTENNFGGTRVVVNKDMRNFDGNGLNDRLSSMIIYEGRWEVCFDVNYRGGCRVFGPGRHASLRELGNEVSSMRRVD